MRHVSVLAALALFAVPAVAGEDHPADRAEQILKRWGDVTEDRPEAQALLLEIAHRRATPRGFVFIPGRAWQIGSSLSPARC